jgi:hypothetical protein
MTYQKPYTFRAGTYAKAAEVNANFDTVKDFVDDLQDAIGNVEVSKTPYNKANLQGNPDVVFYCATSSEANAAVNNTKLTNSLVDINTAVAANAQAIQDNAEEIDGLQAQISGISLAPSYEYGTYDDLKGLSGTFSVNGLVYIANSSTSSNKDLSLNGTAFTIYPRNNVIFPVGQGTTYNFTSFSGSDVVRLFKYT